MVDMIFKQHKVDYHVALEAGGWEVIKKYVEIGMGVSIVTEVCLTQCDKIAKIPLGRYFPQRSYGIVVREGKFLSPQAREFIQMMDPEFFNQQKALD